VNPRDPALSGLPGEAVAAIGRALDRFRPRLETEEVGQIARIGHGVATITGFTDVVDGELVRLPGDLYAVATNLDLDSVGVILLGEGERLRAGDKAWRTRRAIDVPVGEALLGRVVDALGRPLDGKGPIATRERWPIERRAPAIVSRAPVEVPLQTGIKAIDAAIPIGRGQRELILGDRQSGKTSIALDAIANQRGSGVVAVYCAVGQRSSSVARAIESLSRAGAIEQCIVVVAGGEDPPGMQFVAPYAATSMAEFFMEQGRDALIVYDDLTRHARAYRELSLLLRRPPGREAYPGDIFFIHARLLERATHLRAEAGGGSLTALPIIETQAQNISAFIPTNLISITDGQIYVSPELFHKDRLPAIAIGRSVSRVGGKAQLPALRVVAGDLRLAYAQFEELETFARFGTRLDEETRRNLERGRRVREILKQGERAPLPVPEQVAVLLAATGGAFDVVPVEAVAEAEQMLCRALRGSQPELCDRIARGGNLAEGDRTALLDLARHTFARYRP